MTTEKAGPRAIFDLSGRVALVTGAGSGLGRSFAHGLAAFGAHVMCADRDEGWAKETVASLADGGGSGEALHVDVSEPGSVAAMAERIRRSPGRVDVLVNNAGIATSPSRVHEMSIEDWDRLMATNLRGVFLCTRAIIPLMFERGGSVVNVASIASMVGFCPSIPGLGANYAAAKAGVVGLTKQVAVEYAGLGIRVNALAPGWYGGTRLGDERRAKSSPEVLAQFDQAIVRGIPMGRKGNPDELQGIVVFLASAASSYTTGQVFVHDGGWLAT